MSIAKKTLNTLVAGAFVATLSMAAAHDAEAGASKDKEKCYGVVKAGMNDCGALDGSHSCAKEAKVDGDKNEWVLVPKGLCHKLVGGHIAEKAEKDAKD
jgi:uncharacterized membrane protein|tara:strand:+ start:142132 stop:142428 length:297 start_codon:yes stop_codon:yes gene_type:complete